MILVLLGTHELQFTRLLEMVEKCIDEGTIQEKVIVQGGSTKYHTNKMEVLDYLGYNQMESLINESNYIITHGGTGSIVTSLRCQKKVIAFPRLKKYNEHNDDHQVEIVKVLGDEGYIKVCNEEDDLGLLIGQLKEFEPKRFNSDNHIMLDMIRDFITQ